MGEAWDGFTRGLYQSPGITMSLAEMMRDLGRGRQGPRDGQPFADWAAEQSGIPEPTTPRGRVMENVGRDTLPAAVMGGPVSSAAGLAGLGVEIGLSTLGSGASRSVEELGGGGIAQMAADIVASSSPGALGAKAMGKLAPDLAVIAGWHGTPNKWGVNEKLGRVGPDMDRLLTGEGSLMEGSGHYSGGVRDTAQTYRDTLGDVPTLRIAGKEIQPRWASGMDDEPHFRVARTIADRLDSGKSPDEILDELIEGNRMGIESTTSPEVRSDLLAENKELEALRGQIEVVDPGGYIYGLLHDVEPEELLDLDLPLEEQPWFREVEDVVKEYSAAGKNSDDYARFISLANANRGQTGEQFYRNLHTHFGGDPKKVSQFLADVGIPGAKYLDQMSRRNPVFDFARDHPEIAREFNELANAADPYGEADIRVLAKDLRATTAGNPPDYVPPRLAKAIQEAGASWNEGTHNYLMYRDDLTYVDPSRTDKRLWDQLPIGEPFRTVEPMPRPAPVKTFGDAELADEQAFIQGVGGISAGSRLEGQYRPDTGEVLLRKNPHDYSRRSTVFHEQGHHAAMKLLEKPTNEALTDWFTRQGSDSPYFRSHFGHRPDDPLSNAAGVNYDEFVADAYAYVDPYSGKMEIELDPDIGTGTEMVDTPKPLQDALLEMDKKLGGMWKRRHDRAAKKAEGAQRWGDSGPAAGDRGQAAATETGRRFIDDVVDTKLEDTPRAAASWEIEPALTISEHMDHRGNYQFSLEPNADVNVTPDEAKALRRWMDGGLTKGDGARIASVAKKTPTKGDSVMFRGVRDFLDFDEKWRTVGSEFDLDDFTAFSEDTSTAKSFIETAVNARDQAIIRATVPEGVPAVNLAGAFDGTMGVNEGEILIPQGARIRVVKVTPGGGASVGGNPRQYSDLIDIEIIPPTTGYAGVDFPPASDTVDGRRIRDGDNVPNLDSIAATLDDYEILPGLREVPMDAFEGLGRHYSKEGNARIKELAAEIEQSGEISPLIVVVDEDGPYILEGATRSDALAQSGAKSFPAIVVRDISKPTTGRTP